MKVFSLLLKKTLVIALFFFPGKWIHAQINSCAASNDAMDNLLQVNEKIKQLDAFVSYNIYGNLSNEVINNFNKRLSLASSLLDTLETIDRVFKSCAEFYPNDRNYVYYDVLTKFTSLSITTKSSDYLTYLKLDIRNKKQYEDTRELWERRSKELIKSSKSQINKLLQGKAGDEYSKILHAICNYYDSKADQSISELKTVIKDLKAEIATDKNANIESTAKEKYLSFALTWLSYIYNETNMPDKALLAFEEYKSIDEPDSKCTDWLNQTNLKLKDARNKTADLKISDFNLPPAAITFEWKTLLYQKKNLLNNTASDEFYLETQNLSLVTDQAELINQTITTWNKVWEIENAPWEIFIERMQKSGGQFHGSDYDLIYLKLNTQNKGGGDLNLLRYRKRFDDAYYCLNQLRYLNQCWANMINANPDIPLFRLYRIKTNLALSYLSQNMNSFLEFFSYYKIDKKKLSEIHPDYLGKIKDEFSGTNLNTEMNDDINFCTNAKPENIGFQLAKIEISVFTKAPEDALSELTQLENKITANNTIGDINPASLIALYRSYLYFKMGDIQKLKQSISILNSFHNTNAWAKQLNEYLYYFDNKNELLKKNSDLHISN